jgi:lysozyme
VLTGIDVSHHQGPIDWPKVKQAGHAFVFCKATEGDSHLDPKFLANVKGAREAGLLVGAYHFAKPAGGPEDARRQAEHVTAVLARVGGVDLPPVLDIEDGQGRLGGWALHFLTRVEQIERRIPVLYSYVPFVREHLVDTPALARFPLWIARYHTGTSPGSVPPWKSWTFWQHSSSGKVDGIGGNVDLNRFNGSEAQLRALAGAPAPPTGTPTEDFDDDGMNCLIRGWCWTYWGRGPTSGEQTVVLTEFHSHKSVDLALAGITDHPSALAFRKKRGW